jgi:DNA-binding NtrC family response regulator
MSKSVLMVTSMADAEGCAVAIERQLGLSVEVAGTRRAALTALRRGEFSVVVLEETMAVADPQGADLMWQQAGTAVPVQVNFAIASCARLVREVRAALARREQEKTLAMRAASSAVGSELKSVVTGILLQSELALREPAVSPKLQAKLRHLVELAGDLRERLQAHVA